MFDDRRPIYRQIAERIRAEVLSGSLGEDEQVMSTTQYATHFRINPATAAKAFAELVDEGVLYKRRGVGMFVAPGARETLRAHRRARFVAEVLDPMIDEADAIGLDPAHLVERIHERMGDPADPRAAAGSVAGSVADGREEAR
ncbi:MAG: GntR family transcriptional regulator [Nitriliruptoraceae bacterium]|nr:GntR family transcriptional regulator [Nitriliruptoraceae bacterium]